jgi:hypothetical protein
VGIKMDGALMVITTLDMCSQCRYYKAETCFAESLCHYDGYAPESDSRFSSSNMDRFNLDREFPLDLNHVSGSIILTLKTPRKNRFNDLIE